MKEIITLQFGSLANFVGAHFWNAQNEAASSSDGPPATVADECLYRVGEGPSGITYYPRCLIFDVKAGFGDLMAEPVPDGEEILQQTWLGKLDTIQERRPERNFNPFLAAVRPQPPSPQTPTTSATASLDHTEKKPRVEPDPTANIEKIVETWADFLKQEFHPNSFIALPDRQTNETFRQFEQGAEAFAAPDMQALFEERMHYFLEECDTVQAFHCMTTAESAWGAFTLDALAALHEEAPKVPVVMFAPFTGNYKKSQTHSGPASDAAPTSTAAAEATPLTGQQPPAPGAGKAEDDAQIEPLPAEEMHEIASRYLMQTNYAKTLMGACSRESNLCSLVFPLSASHWTDDYINLRWPHLQFQPHLEYHSTALMAAAVDTLTSSYRNLARIRDSSCASFVASLQCVPSMKLPALSVAMPMAPAANPTRPTPANYAQYVFGHSQAEIEERTVASGRGETPKHILGPHVGALWPPFPGRSMWVAPPERMSSFVHVHQPMTAAEEKIRRSLPAWSEAVTLRGLVARTPEDRVSTPYGSIPLGTQEEVAAAVDQCLRLSPCRASARTIIPQAFSIPLSFPHIFRPTLTADGMLRHPLPARPGNPGQILTCPTLTRAHMSPSCGIPLAFLADSLQARRYAGFTSGGGELTDLIEDLRAGAEAFTDEGAEL
ncbi:putative protein dml1 [Paratrimastix pyriformis]|uniref:Uncharacterized protein n=1 Tax=Paratrimastix pyriformis TaxID=342808 RepID=A0ABQ8UIX3_9EUKA|nr:putative protein dml1 [Paratrimastix pyriformis]